MSRLVEATDVYSNNFFAEMLVKLLGAHFGGAGTTAAGTDVVERFARGQGSAIQAVDGSGLTRGNRASPYARSCDCCRRCAASAVGDEFIQDLAPDRPRGNGRRPHAKEPPPTAAAAPRPAP